MKPTERGRLLYKLADLIERDAAHLAEIEVRDNGKLIAEMSGQTHYMPQWYRYYGGLADKVEGAVIPTEKGRHFQLHAVRTPGRGRHDHRLEFTFAADDLETGRCSSRRQHGDRETFGIHLGLDT
ncbi:MAG: hypothetical protein Ct9H300mP16_04570 [Pseudomonadota bacterium]|nr:MAG: hypothetical protein Ct9H300mP16_04570 [Pseudomonadota bacterium]